MICELNSIKDTTDDEIALFETNVIGLLIFAMILNHRGNSRTYLSISVNNF